MSDATEEMIGVCPRCGQVKWNVRDVPMCRDCRRVWEVMSLRDAVYFLSDVVRLGGRLASLSRIADLGGRVVTDGPDKGIWDGKRCAAAAREALDVLLSNNTTTTKHENEL